MYIVRRKYLHRQTKRPYSSIISMEEKQKKYSNPGYGIDGDDRKEIDAYEALQRYIWEHPHNEEVQTLYDKFEKKDVDAQFALGFIYSGLGVHWNITKRGQHTFDLKFKPRTLWEKIIDFWYFKIIGVRLFPE